MDGTMCKGAGCLLKEQCHRYTAIPNEYRQAYASFELHAEAVDKCEYFWDNSGYDKSNFAGNGEDNG